MDLALTRPMNRNSQQAPIDYRRRLLLFLTGWCACKLFFAFYLELGNDEAYYWAYSRHLQWNYFDHPPMVAVWIRLFSMNGALDPISGFLRLGSVAGSALAAWFLYRTVALVHSERAGWYAAVLYQCSIYAGITAGLYILPDAPQMVFWTASLWAMARIVKTPERWQGWLLFGTLSGLCILSKVHGIFLWAGMGGYVLFRKRDLLFRPPLYVSVLITVALVSPVLLWNLHYHFITYRFHSQRVRIQELTFLGASFLREAGSQLSFNHPLIVVLSYSGLFAWLKRRWTPMPALACFAFTGLPLALVLLVIALFRDTTLPHWSGPAYVSVLPFAAIALAERSRKGWPLLLRWSIGLFAAVLIGWTVAVEAYPGTWGRKDSGARGRGDISLDMYGWNEAGRAFEKFYRDEEAAGRAPAGLPLVATHWWGAHVDYYFARRVGQPLIGLGFPFQLNHYLWLNRWTRRSLDRGEAYCIMASDNPYHLPDDYFSNVRRVTEIPVVRNGAVAHYFWVYRLSGLKKAIPVIDSIRLE